MNKKQSNLLKAWSVTEALTMPDFDYEEVKMVDLLNNTSFPWSNQRNKQDFRIYLGISPVKKIMEYIRDSFQSKEEFHQYSSEKTYLAVIRVTHNGTYIEDSLDFPYVSYFIGKMNDLHKNELYTNLAERYETIKKELHKLFNQKFQNTPVGHEEINEMTSVLSKYLNWP